MFRFDKNKCMLEKHFLIFLMIFTCWDQCDTRFFYKNKFYKSIRLRFDLLLSPSLRFYKTKI